MKLEEYFEEWWTQKELPEKGFNKTAMLDFAEMYHKQALRIHDVMARFSNENFITNVCLSFRHDYGLMSANERNILRFECKEWLRAIVNNWDNTRTHVFLSLP